MEDPAEGVEIALDLIDFTLRMFRDRLRRENPEWTNDQIDQRVRAWFHRRPGATHGDGEGVPASWPRP